MTGARPLLLALLASLATALGGCSLVRPTLHAAEVESVLKPNQKIEIKTMWAKAKPLVVRLRQPGRTGGGVDVSLRAVHDGRAISLLAMWVDPTESGERLEWRWSQPSGKYYEVMEPTDMFAAKLCISGSQKACMMTGEEGVYDVWQWRAGWSHVSGHADDRTLTISRTPPEAGEAQAYPLGDTGEAVYMLWRNDEGDMPYEFAPRPMQFKRPLMPGIKSREATGSAGDVLAEAVYQEGAWMLELWRLLETKNADDYQIKGSGPHKLSIAVGNGQEGPDHYTSEMIYLELD